MSDKSEEELVGDVDFDFDLLDDARPTNQIKHQTDKYTESSVKKPVNIKKKVGVKTVAVQDDLLQAFSLGAKSVKKVSDNTAKRKPLVKGKSNTGVVTAKQNDNSTRSANQIKEKTAIDKMCADKGAQVEKMLVKKEGKEKNKIEMEVNKNEDEKVVEKKIYTKATVPDLNNKTEDSSKNSNEVVEGLAKVERPTQENTAPATSENKILESPTEKNKAPETSENNNSKLDHRNEDNFVKVSSSAHSHSNKTQASIEIGKKETVKSAHDVSQECLKQSNVERSLSDSSVTKTKDCKSTMQDLKRKADDVSDKSDLQKARKTDKSAEANVDQTMTKNSFQFTAEDYKSMDIFLADQMLEKSKKKTILRNGIKYIVEVSPLEIADLAHPSLQQLIQLHPSMSLIFKHQTVKFKKKKGFAEAAFSTMTELKEFVYQLTQIKVFEKRINVTIKAMDHSGILSFVIHLNRNGKLLELLDSGEDPLINKPIPIGENSHKIQFEKVPCNANGAFMHSMFPFTNNVLITRSRAGKERKAEYLGPVSVFYVSPTWLEAVMDCCSDFTVNGFPLTVVGDYCPDKNLKEMDSAQKRRTSIESDQRIHAFMDTYEHEDNKDVEDDPVSNMTRDVCADMLESIQKLKELDSNNPNMKKIVEMQIQLNALQNSLGKSQSLTSIAFPAHETDCSKDAKLTSTEKKKRDTKSLEEKFEEAERAERQKEEQVRQQREMEVQKRKEFEQKKKTKWMKNILSDFKKQEGAIGEKLSVEAEKILQQREQRLKEKEEEEKRRKDEEEKLKRQQEKEEKYREAERKRLIEKIEEARLKDTQKFSSSQLLWNPSSSNSSPPVGSKRAKDDDQRDYGRKESAKKSNNAGKVATSPNKIDDGVDERLADFERELMEQGKIENERSTGRCSSKREETWDKTISEEEYQNLLANKHIQTIPERSLKVRVSSYANRLCPVLDCPSRTNFRTKELFMDHWVIFHQAQTTMRFCPKCSAYFMNPEELENHIKKHHRLSSKEAIELARYARKKVIPNPSYRDPHPFIPPFSPT